MHILPIVFFYHIIINAYFVFFSDIYTTVEKFGVSKMFLKKFILLLNKDAFKTFTLSQKNSTSIKCCFEPPIHQRILNNYHSFHKNSKQHNYCQH